MDIPVNNDGSRNIVRWLNCFARTYLSLRGEYLIMKETQISKILKWLAILFVSIFPPLYETTLRDWHIIFASASIQITAGVLNLHQKAKVYIRVSTNRFTRIYFWNYDGAFNANKKSRHAMLNVIDAALKYPFRTRRHDSARKDVTKWVVKYDTARSASLVHTRNRSRRILRGPYLIFGTRLRLVSAPQFSRLRPLQLRTLLFQEWTRPPWNLRAPANFTPAHSLRIKSDLNLIQCITRGMRIFAKIFFPIKKK